MPEEMRAGVATEAELDLDQPSGPSIDVTRLYRLWEANPWSAHALDFTQDARDWRERLTPAQRSAAYWHYAQFLQGEEAVARTLAPFVEAVPTQEQRVFITTQIADEARHHVFFDRFMREVVGLDGDMAGKLDAIQPELTGGFKRVFAALDRLTDRLRRRPDNRALLAQSIVLYHFIVEGMLAQPSQHIIGAYLDQMGVLPGFSEGMKHVSRDETRHVAFGVQVLGELVAAYPEAKPAVIRLLNRILPWAMCTAFSPQLGGEPFAAFGWTTTDTFAYGIRSLETKLTRAGILPGEVAALVKIGVDLPPREQAERALRLLNAGVLGDVAPLSVDDDILALMFDSLERVVNMRPAARLPGDIQWEFADAKPWYLTVEDGRVVAQLGRVATPVATLRCRVDDWARIAGDKLSPLWAVATGRLKLSGERAALMRLPAILSGA